MNFPRLSPALRWLALPVLAGLLAGCGGSLDTGYTLDLVYPLRKDPLVITLPTEDPTRSIAPGNLDEFIRRLPESKGVLLDPVELAEGTRTELNKVLDDLFGKPAAPTVKVELEKTGPEARRLNELLEEDDVNLLVPNYLKAMDLLDPVYLAEGGKLYRRHCMHCHGVAGDGRGASGVWLSPSPRDFRQGVFKFTSGDPKKPKRARRIDILRTLSAGIEGTSMPSFALLGELERKQLTSYVLHLSLRGETEFKMLELLLKPAKGETLTTPQIRDRASAKLFEALYEYNVIATLPGATPTSKPSLQALEPGQPDFDENIRLGYRLFIGEGGCVSCHKDFGRQSGFKYDEWGTVVRPNNLTAGVYRGGRRPIDLFYRLRVGISGSRMPAIAFMTPEDRAKPENKDKAALTDDQVWALINFVRMVPYPDQLPDDVRQKVYGKADTQAVKREGGHD